MTNQRSGLFLSSVILPRYLGKKGNQTRALKYGTSCVVVEIARTWTWVRTFLLSQAVPACTTLHEKHTPSGTEHTLQGRNAFWLPIIFIFNHLPLLPLPLPPPAHLITPPGVVLVLAWHLEIKDENAKASQGTIHPPPFSQFRSWWLSFSHDTDSHTHGFTRNLVWLALFLATVLPKWRLQVSFTEGLGHTYVLLDGKTSDGTSLED